jgi:hypothetical protein
MAEIHKQHLSITTALVRADAYVLADQRPLDDFFRNVSDASHLVPSSAAPTQHSMNLGVRDAQRHREEPGEFAND